jgi:hypothetical protein
MMPRLTALRLAPAPMHKPLDKRFPQGQIRIHEK